MACSDTARPAAASTVAFQVLKSLAVKSAPEISRRHVTCSRRIVARLKVPWSAAYS